MNNKGTKEARLKKLEWESDWLIRRRTYWDSQFTEAGYKLISYTKSATKIKVIHYAKRLYQYIYRIEILSLEGNNTVTITITDMSHAA